MVWLLTGVGFALALACWLSPRPPAPHPAHRGYIAEEYPAFLNQTAERNLLRKVGGGYTFVHALLLQYFSGRA
jgi:hypothetical protein